MKFIKNFALAFFSISRNDVPIEYRYAAVIFCDVSAALLLSLCKLPDNEEHHTICIFKNIIGYPCPACGTTRGLIYFFHAMPYDAIMMNPIAVFVGTAMILTFIWSIYDIIMHKRSMFKFTQKEIPWYFVVLIVVFLIFNEVWNIKKNL